MFIIHVQCNDKGFVSRRAVFVIFSHDVGNKLLHPMKPSLQQKTLLTSQSKKENMVNHVPVPQCSFS